MVPGARREQPGGAALTGAAGVASGMVKRSSDQWLRSYQNRRRPCAGDDLAADDPSRRRQASREGRLIVVGEDVLPQRQHPVDRRIGLGHELDHAARCQTGQPGDGLVQRHVAADRQMVLEGERQHGVGLRPAAEARAAPPAASPGPGWDWRRPGRAAGRPGSRPRRGRTPSPAPAGRNRSRPRCPLRPRARARHSRRCCSRGRTAAAAGCARRTRRRSAASPAPPPTRSCGCRHSRPRRWGRYPPARASRSSGGAGSAGRGTRSSTAGARGPSRCFACGFAIAARCSLACRTTWLMHVPRELAAQRQQALDLEHADALETAAIPRVVRHPGQRPQQQRVQELLAELPVAEPVLALAVAPQRQHVDEDRPRALELHVVGAGIGQRDAAARAGRGAGRDAGAPRP